MATRPSSQRCWIGSRLCAGQSRSFPTNRGEPCLYGASFVCGDIIMLKRKGFRPPNYCHKCGISLSSIRPCGFLGHSVVISHSCPPPSSFPHWNPIPHLSTKLAGHCPVSPLLWGLLPHTTALVSSHAKQTWLRGSRTETTSRSNRPRCTPSQTSNVNKVDWSGQEDANSAAVGKCLRNDPSSGFNMTFFFCNNYCEIEYNTLIRCLFLL